MKNRLKISILTLTFVSSLAMAENAIIDKSNWLKSPTNVAAFQNINQVTTTAVISRQGSPVAPLPSSIRNLDDVEFNGVVDGKPAKLTLADHLKGTYTDSFLVLHNGRVVYERYFNGMSPYKRHMMMSVTKSFAGTMLAVLIDEGKIDETRSISDYIPELKQSVWKDVSVRQLLNMTTGVDFSENFSDPDSPIWNYSYSIGLGEPPSDYKGPKNIEAFLKTMKRAEPAGRNFVYVTPSSEVVCWLIRKQTGKSFATVLSDRIWSKIGAENDALIATESTNKALAASGLFATARDLARFGQMILQRGTYNGQQILNPNVVEGFIKGGDREAFKAHDANGPQKGYSYRDQWWVSHNEHNAFMALGIYGQAIYIDPTANMVIIKQSSQPTAQLDFSDNNEPLIYHALAKYLMAND